MFKTIDNKLLEFFSKDIRLSADEVYAMGLEEFEALKGRLALYLQEIEGKERAVSLIRRRFFRVLLVSVLVMGGAHLAGWYGTALSSGFLGAALMFILYRNLKRLEAVSMALQNVYCVLKRSVDLRG